MVCGVGVEVQIPVRWAAHHDHERDIRAEIQKSHPDAYVEFRRVDAITAQINGQYDALLHQLATEIVFHE